MCSTGFLTFRDYDYWKYNGYLLYSTYFNLWLVSDFFTYFHQYYKSVCCVNQQSLLSVVALSHRRVPFEQNCNHRYFTYALENYSLVEENFLTLLYVKNTMQ